MLNSKGQKYALANSRSMFLWTGTLKVCCCRYCMSQEGYGWKAFHTQKIKNFFFLKDRKHTKTTLSTRYIHHRIYTEGISICILI